MSESRENASRQQVGETCAEWIKRCGKSVVEAILRQDFKKYGVDSEGKVSASSLEKARAAQIWLDEGGKSPVPFIWKERIAELLAAYAASAVVLEREQCAQIAGACGGSASEIAERIRARGERKEGENG